jgi:hypothetical protein
MILSHVAYKFARLTTKDPLRRPTNATKTNDFSAHTPYAGLSSSSIVDGSVLLVRDSNVPEGKRSGG